MSYYVRVELVNVEIKPDQLDSLTQYINEHKEDLDDFHIFLRYLQIEDGSLYWDPEESVGKWYDEKTFARWLCPYVEKGAMLIIYSEEGDGSVYGWEFDGKGKMRRLELRATGRWI